MKLNLPITGFIIGLLLPLVGMFITYMLKAHGESVGSFVTLVIHQKGVAAKVVLLSVLINLIPFAWFNVKRLDYAMRGVFVATMLYALLVIMLMFVW